MSDGEAEQEYVSDELLLQRLDAIRKNVTDGVYAPEVKQDIYDSTEMYVTGKVAVDGETLQLMVMAWILKQSLGEMPRDDVPE